MDGAKTAPRKTVPVRDEDRPVPVSGEVETRADAEPAPVLVSHRKATTAVLEAYTDDAHAAVTDYERQIIGEKDVRRVGRLHYEIGRLYETVIGDWPSASAHYDKALSALPDHLPTIVGARRVRLRVGQYDKALELFDREIRVCSSRSRSAALWFAKARVLEDDLGRSAEARAAYQAASDLSEGDPVRLKALEESDRARKAYPSLSEVFGETAEAVRGDARLRATVLIQRARVEDTFQDNPDGATQLFEGALEAYPDAPGALQALARLHENAGRWRDLVRVLMRQADLANDKHQRALLLHRIGRLYDERLSDRDKAIKATAAAVRAMPDPVIIDSLVSLHEAAGNAGDAAEALSQLAELTIDDRERLLILQRIGELCHYRLEDDDSAIAALQAALEIDPTHVPVLRLLAPIYYGREAWPELITLHEREAEATTDTRRRAVAHVRTADIYERIDEPGKAVQHLERALSLDSKNSGAFDGLVRLYRATRTWRTLAELYESQLDAVDVDRRIAYLFEIGKIQAEFLDDAERAEHALKRVLQLRPEHLGAVHAMQKVAEEAGRYPQLVEALELEAKLIEDEAQIVGLLHRAGAVLDERIGERPRAIATFKRVLALDDKHLPTLAHLGRMYHALGTVERFGGDLRARARGNRARRAKPGAPAANG